MGEDIIIALLHIRESKGTLNIQSDELKKHTDKRKKDSKELFDFINKKVHPQIRAKLIQLIEQYNNDYSIQTYSENELYYKAGFSDGIKVLLDALDM